MFGVWSWVVGVMGFCEWIHRDASRASGPSRPPLSPSPAIQPSYNGKYLEWYPRSAFFLPLRTPPSSARHLQLSQHLHSPQVVQQQFPLRYESTTNDSYCKHTIPVHLRPCDFTGNSDVFSQKNFDETTVRKRCIHHSPRIIQNPNSIAPTT